MSKENLSDIAKRWRALTSSFNMFRTERRKIWKVLETRYTEEGRYYHTLDHIENGLVYLDYLGADRITKLAWFWHDVVYDAASKTNEEDSALKLGEWEDYFPTNDDDGTPVILEAQRLIRLTAGHKPHVLDERGKQICVADLIGMASPYPVYEMNGQNIREEYRQFTDEEWKIGRKAFLESWDGKLFPYSIRGVKNYHVVEWNRQALLNMQTERATLGE